MTTAASSSLCFLSSSNFFGSRVSATPSTSHNSRVTYSRPVASYNSARIATSASLYETLGLSDRATCQEIKSAYRRLARACHPDVVASDKKDKSASEFMKIHAAYSTLSDPDKRADYDRRILRSRKPYASAFTVGSPRKWETDQCW